MESERISDIVKALRGVGAVNLADRIEEAALREFEEHYSQGLADAEKLRSKIAHWTERIANNG